MIEAARLRLTDLSLWEWDQTDMRAWHLYVNALNAWADGKRMATETRRQMDQATAHLRVKR